MKIIKKADGIYDFCNKSGSNKYFQLVIAKTIGRWTFGFHFEKIRSPVVGISCDFYSLVIPVWYFTFIK